MKSVSSMADFQSQGDTSTVKLMKESLSSTNILTGTDRNIFENLFSRYALEKSNVYIPWDKIEPPPEGMVLPYDKLESDIGEDNIKDILNKLVVLKLNGGLGTSMGCKGPKSVIEVRNGLTFLDLTVRQVEYLNTKYDVNIPLVLMNSFYTADDTERIIRKYNNHNIKILCFSQHCFPRIDADSLLPVPHEPFKKEDINKWYPPGHGDIYDAFVHSTIFEELKEMDKELVFISNIDNLGATVDLKIPNHMLSNGIEFVMEVTDKTVADVKGGTLINYEGKATLLEIAQVSNEHVEEFKSVKKFKIFNTNNLWLSFGEMERLVLSGELKCRVIQNKKMLDGKPIIQLETACGDAIQFFQNAMGINVPRSRFLPVKSTSDLMLVQSNLYDVEHGSLIRSPARIFPTLPIIKLGSSLSHVNDYNKRIFPVNSNIIDLDHLTVSGDVWFGPSITLRGTVIIVAEPGNVIMIPEGAVLENKVITGNLRILEH